MHTLLVYRNAWNGKTRIGESTDGYCNDLFSVLVPLVHRRATHRAERERDLCSGIGDPSELALSPVHLHRVACKPRLSAEDAARSTLARVVMANRIAHRLPRYRRSELATGARSSSSGHCLVSSGSAQLSLSYPGSLNRVSELPGQDHCNSNRRKTDDWSRSQARAL